MTDAVIAILAIVGFAVAALESVGMTVMAFLLLKTGVTTFQHERRISELEAGQKQMRTDIDEVDVVVDRTLDAANVSRNGVLREEVKKSPFTQGGA